MLFHIVIISLLIILAITTMIILIFSLLIMGLGSIGAQGLRTPEMLVRPRHRVREVIPAAVCGLMRSPKWAKLWNPQP